jgi:hypothetical protein
MVFIQDAAERAGFEEVHAAFPVVQAAIQTEAAAILQQGGEKPFVGFNADAVPAKRRFEQMGIAHPHTVRSSGIEEKPTPQISQDAEDNEILT